MKILYISPHYFSPKSCIGGGERYAYELAKAISEREEVVLLSFGEEQCLNREGNLTLEYLNRPRFKGSSLFWNTRFRKWLAWADVIHCHQVFTGITDAVLIFNEFLKKQIVITDHGGGEGFSWSYHLPILRRSTAFLLVSEYSKAVWEKANVKHKPGRLEVIGGGVDIERFSPDPSVNKLPEVLFVGRLLPHKGIDVLIDAMCPDIPLNIVGRAYHPEYFELLKIKSKNKTVRFYTACSDEELVRLYRQSAVTVLPSVYKDCYGNWTATPELLGLVALESMACATPVIGTQVTSLPEIVQEGQNGFLVPPNDPLTLGKRINFLVSNFKEVEMMGKDGREKILKHFTWSATADRCLKSYRAQTFGMQLLAYAVLLAIGFHLNQPAGL